MNSEKKDKIIDNGVDSEDRNRDQKGRQREKASTLEGNTEKAGDTC